MGKKKKKREQVETLPQEAGGAPLKGATPHVIIWTRGRTPERVLFWEGLTSENYAVLERFTNLLAVDTKGYSGHMVPLDEVVPKFFKMKAAAAKDAADAPYLLPLIHVIEEEKRLTLDATAKNLGRGLVKYDDLWGLLHDGAEVVFEDAGVLHGGTVLEAAYVRGGWAPSFSLKLSCVAFDEGGFGESTRTVRVPLFEEMVSIADLPVRPIDPQTKQRLGERGARVRTLLEGGVSYVNYSGDMLWRTWFGHKRFCTAGRIMVDPVTFWKLNENYNNEIEMPSEVQSKPQMAADSAWMVSPWLLGFSFDTKLWGEFNVEKISAIQFNSRAYDQLVMPDRKIGHTTVNVKALVRSLVEHGDLGFADFIANKGGGMIFLLHGPPGGGKTLTAEAIADLLKRPLYAISVGELGTSPDSLEKRLRTVLEVAVLWNAVLLIDEADIFLERRTSDDIERNALVSIFLRLLEYHQGVLFLTTNRVVNLDEAFHSRVSLALHYPEHGPNERRSIWTNLLEAAGIDQSALDLSELAEAPLNGRQIKHVVRIASAVARAAGRSVEQGDLEQILALSHQFVQDLKREEVASNVRQLAPLGLKEGS